MSKSCPSPLSTILYGMYLEEEDTLRIVEVKDNDLDFVLDIEGPANPYMDL